MPDGAGDQADAEALYNVLENEVVPLFYERDEHDLPRQWIARSKEAIRTLGPMFSSQRMVIDYITELYTPACEGGLRWAESAVGATKR